MNTYKIDSAHSEINFRVKHLMISTVTGQFTDFDATLTSETDALEDAQVTFEARVASISTGNAQRDAHLKSNDFFNADEFPTLRFESTSLKQLSDEDYELKGDLTIRDVTKPVTLKAIYGGRITDPYGQNKIGFDLSGSILRKDFKLNWDGVTEAGGVVVSNEVKLLLHVQLVHQEQAEAVLA